MVIKKTCGFIFFTMGDVLRPGILAKFHLTYLRSVCIHFPLFQMTWYFSSLPGLRYCAAFTVCCYLIPRPEQVSLVGQVKQYTLSTSEMSRLMSVE